MNARLASNGLEVILSYKGETDRLQAKTYPFGAEEYFAQFAAMHLLGPRMPRKIYSDFPIAKPMQVLIGKMYKSEGRTPPEIHCRSYNPLHSRSTSSRKAVVSFSAGKDSLWNLMNAQKRYGAENVLAVHIAGLNKSNGSDERKYAIRQSKKFGFDLEVLELKNGSAGGNYKVMVSRDMFLTGILIPYAHGFGAAHIWTEGFGETSDLALFTGQEDNMKMFNDVLRKLGLGVRVKWKNRSEMSVIRDMYEQEPDWMKEVCNCFSANCFKAAHRKNMQKKLPSFRLYDSQCGVCLKCRTVNIGRILWEPGFRADDEDVRAYIKSTENWLFSNSTNARHRDIITESFKNAIRRAAMKNRVVLKKL
ncbi:hypothetical protein JW711_03630 [Candidatus Woesearchaeota archaeon]|nr:hypothetical protein [Candidatus Woesearchaeota archaeon]